mgnify:CR=1 FL=1
MFVLGTNDDNGTLFIAGVEREAWDYHSEYFPCWEQLPEHSMTFNSWMDADEYRSRLKRLGITARLYIWEWHPS